MIVELAWDMAAAVTTSDTTDQYKGKGAAGFVVAVGGLVNLDVAGVTVAVPAAAGIPIRLRNITRFRTATTTATGIVAFFDALNPKIT